MTRSKFRLDWSARTDRGSVRDHNEDAFAALPEQGVWIVADGMGGHESGDWASQVITRSIGELPHTADFEVLLSACSDAIHRANSEIYAKGQERGAQIGSTVVGLVVSGGAFGVLWAGDSRAYLLRGGVLHQLTTDHTQVQALVDRGILPPEEAKTHPMAHVLAKAVGVEPTLELEGFTDSVQPGDTFLLCSDGLHGVLDDAEIQQLLMRGRFDESSDALVDRCLVVGARDNVTVVIVQAQEPTQLIFASTGAQPAFETPAQSATGEQA